MDDLDKASGGFWGWVIAAIVIVVGISLEGEDSLPWRDTSGYGDSDAQGLQARGLNG
ncbi:hypothetical protein [Asticcacaulis sp.]|uniref:hypothetical protein n=1 Tax=Asticcacaulis sp. TaxID=1872648 RepID=UPI0026114C67|nr:hypothetical protein [Asticcacaulis sp.]